MTAPDLPRYSEAMPTGPDGQKRPDSTIANAVHIAKMAVGEAEERYPKRTRTKRKKPKKARQSS